MALQLKVSNSLHSLAEKFCQDLRSAKRSVFSPDFIVTQTEGMNSWLKLRMADRLGIAANHQFLKPNDLIHRVYRILGGKYQQPLSVENQRWLLYKILAEGDFTRRFPEVAAYYLNAADDQDLKRMALAEKVADFFDQYQIYRADMIREWNTKSLTEMSSRGDEWQQYLWIRCKNLLGDRLPDKSAVGDFILNALKDPASQHRLQQSLSVAYIFGLSVTTSFHLEIFHEIAKYSTISFYLLNPSPSVYWFEDRSEKQLAFLMRKGWALPDDTVYGNGLLTSWGKVIQNTFSLLFQSDDLLNSYEEVGLAEPLGSNLLHKIQQDIFHNRASEDRSPLSLEELRDGSLTIQSCYTPAREVEVLYNYLVHLVDQRKAVLSARDIVVMVTDVDAYAPYIRAVFDNAPYKFPYTIADESYTADDTIASALKSVLLLNKENFKAEMVMQVLDSRYIRKRFGITDLGLIRKVVDGAGIRFGIEGSTEDDSRHLSWKHGLKRIIYGICMSGDEAYNDGDEDLYPLDRIEGQASHEVIRFCHFIEMLVDSIESRKGRKKLEDWSKYLEEVLSNLIVDNEEGSEEDYQTITRHLEKYKSMIGILDEELSYEVFSRTFLQSLDTSSKTGSFAAGGVTFCSLIPMRSIPFKVVCLLGLNFDKFPRKEQSSGYNLMEREKRKGDRNVKENDKHLFLETLLSARDYLYLSYTGQNVKDNAHLPPSALIDELTDYILAGINEPGAEKEHLITRHPLHPFSKKYKKGLPGLYDYIHRTAKPAPSATLITGREPEKLSFEEIAVESFISFFKHPVKAYFNRVLSIRYEDESVLLSETEVFETDRLQEWSLKKMTLNLQEDERELLRRRLVKTASLPLRNMSEVVFGMLEEEVSPVRELFESCIKGKEKRSEIIDLDFPELNMRLAGKISGLYGDKLVTVCWSKNELKYMMETYLRFLVVRAAGIPASICFISSASRQICHSVGIDEIDARARLRHLLELYKEGHELVLPFWPDFKIKPEKIAGLDQGAFQKAVKDVVTDFNYPCDDPYILQKYNEGYFDEDLSWELYQQSALLLLEPLVDLFSDYYDA